jgi:hypothetical protein
MGYFRKIAKSSLIEAHGACDNANPSSGLAYYITKGPNNFHYMELHVGELD